MSLEDRLGKFLVRGLREEPLAVYFSLKQNALTDNIPAHFSEELRLKRMKEYELFQSLSEDQLKQLDTLITSVVDHAAFSFLRETQESMDECLGTEKINLTIENKRATELDLVSGSLFGDYLVWVEKYSKYGEVKF